MDAPPHHLLRKHGGGLPLTSHPLDCPICDQAGECKLQEYSNDYGQVEGRFEEKKTKKGKNLSIGPRVNLDQERCVLCGRGVLPL